MTQVVYIASWLRSGTTILGYVLGSYEGAVFVGELSNLYLAYLRNHECSCGAGVADCPFWSSLLDRVRDDIPHRPSVEAMELDRAEATRWQRSVVSSRHPLGISDASARYSLTLAAMYREIAASTGASVIVDSSKTPAGLLCAAAAPGVRLAALHLIRDPRAVAASESKHVEWEGVSTHLTPPVYSPAQSAARWLSFNLAIEGTGRLLRPKVDLWRRWHYESAASCARRWCDPFMEQVMGARPISPFTTNSSDAYLRFMHVPAGNPLKFVTSGLTPFTARDTWRGELSSGDIRTVEAITLPLRLAYGYRRIGA
jgi:hypothetical protein